ncbi:MAG: glycerate kinase [Muribaculaceae bacterium]|nr:glycerate kinase [Muribaculaceae bacterium]
MKIVVCPDSFKGSLGAKEVAETISESLLGIYPNAEIIQIPLADGGEGTAEIIKKHRFPNEIKLKTHDPLGRELYATIHTDLTGKKAFIESAKIIGLPLLKEEERNPFKASTYGLGEVIQKAIDSGVEEITVSLGGSATCDGGEGMLQSLGNWDKNLIHFNILCDVANPLLGKFGAVNVFSPQKGAKPEDLPVLEKRMEDFVEKLKQKGLCSEEDTKREGAGAAGGLGFAFQAILKAKTYKGIDYILDLTEFDNQIKGASLIITGEGKIDTQSLMGKVVSGVLIRAMKEKIPVVAIAGKIEDRNKILEAGLKETFEIIDKGKSLEKNMQPATTKKNIRRTIEIMSKSNIFQQTIS